MKLKKKIPLKNSMISKRILTFYDLIEAIQEQVDPENDGLVTDVAATKPQIGAMIEVPSDKQKIKADAPLAY